MELDAEELWSPESTHDMNLAHETEIILAIAGVSSAQSYKRSKKLNDQGFKLKHAKPDDAEAPLVTLNVHCSERANILSPLDAAREAKRRLGEIFGREAVVAAQTLVAERRASADGASSSTANVFAHMGETQRLTTELGRLQNETEAARIRLANARAAALAKDRDCDELFAHMASAREVRSNSFRSLLGAPARILARFWHTPRRARTAQRYVCQTTASARARERF